MMKIKPLILLLSISVLFACDKTKNMLTNKSDIDRTHAPKPGAAPEINIGNYKKFTLDNGLKVILVENHKTPEVSYQLNLDIDPELEGDKAGLSALAGTLLKAGTTTKTKSEIDEEIDFVGGWISTAAEGIYATSLTKHSDVILELVSDILLHPTFPQEELDKEKKSTISSLAANETDPSVISDRVSSIVNYGKDHPYGEFETEETINNITREDLVNYYNTFFRPNVGYLVIVGDITEEKAKENAEKYFGQWKPKEVPKFTYSQPQPPKNNRVIVVPVDGAVQSIINITYPVDIKPGGENNVAATLMNKIFGGNGFSSRLMQNIREDKGYTYGAYSSLVKDKLIGEFAASASVRNEVTDSALTQFLYEMDYMVSNLVADSTLRLMKNNSLGKIALSLESPETVADFALNIEKYHLPADFYDSYLKRLESLTKEDILEAAKKYILPNNCNIVVTGNAEEIADKLASFSPDGKVEMLDDFGNPWTGMKKVPAGITEETVFDNYIEAIGGKEKLETIKNYQQSGKMNVQGMAMDMLLMVKGNDKMNLNISMGPNSMMKQIVNGNRGMQIQQGQQISMKDDELTTSRMHMDLLSCLHLDNYGLKANLLGIEDFDGEPCYVIAIESKDEELISTDYYSVREGFKKGSKSTFDSPNGPIAVVSVFKDYKSFDGILVPTVSEQKIGPQTMVFIIENMEKNIEISDNMFDF